MTARWRTALRGTGSERLGEGSSTHESSVTMLAALIARKIRRKTVAAGFSNNYTRFRTDVPSAPSAGQERAGSVLGQRRASGCHLGEGAPGRALGLYVRACVCLGAMLRKKGPFAESGQQVERALWC